MDMKVRYIVASAPDNCDNYPCKKNCPQFILFKDQVRNAILKSNMYLSMGCNSVPRDNQQYNVDQLVDAIFECMV